ncbi:hypothetical protein TRAPUB_11649 [Trametes pubescens]|uniref:Uncharacterized protein n=1 Tax=Trametes pubescens TaxID=154538 RepID=A0A1M2VW43_TRAPU|nr:hypothetical protein TRAPUB_11649 [Trametes pubescens]
MKQARDTKRTTLSRPPTNGCTRLHPATYTNKQPKLKGTLQRNGYLLPICTFYTIRRFKRGLVLTMSRPTMPFCATYGTR